MGMLKYGVSVEDLRIYKRTKIGAIIDEFINSGEAAAEYTFGESEYKTAHSAANSLWLHLKKRGLNQIGVHEHKGRVFLYRKEIWNG